MRSPTGRPVRPIILPPMDIPGKPDSLPAIGRDLAAVVKREAHQPAATFVRRVAATVKKFRGDLPLSEDVTLLTLGRLSEEST